MINTPIHCPQCKTEIRLTESLAASLFEPQRQQYEDKLKKKDVEFFNLGEELRKREETLNQEKRALNERVEEQVEERVKKDRVLIASQESQKAKALLGHELEHTKKELSDLQEALKSKDKKLTEAQSAQAEYVKKQRALDDEKREIELTIEKRVTDEQDRIRIQARQEIENSMTLKLREKDEAITQIKKQLLEAQRKADQGSQQLQGEVQELELEEMLKTNFPNDIIEAVPKGEYGGDILQRVFNDEKQEVGTILWESKRTKSWNNDWLTKLRDDQRAAKAEHSVLISQAIPQYVEIFSIIEGVYVTHPRTALPIAACIRKNISDIFFSRKISEGHQTKQGLVYQYLTGKGFRHHVEAIVETFRSMNKELEKERTVIQGQWAKRRKQIDRITLSTVGMYGDLRGIAGQTLLEIESLEMDTLTIEENYDEQPLA